MRKKSEGEREREEKRPNKKYYLAMLPLAAERTSKRERKPTNDVIIEWTTSDKEFPC